MRINASRVMGKCSKYSVIVTIDQIKKLLNSADVLGVVIDQMIQALDLLNN
jgi:hypothetical protein